MLASFPLRYRDIREDLGSGGQHAQKRYPPGWWRDPVTPAAEAAVGKSVVRPMREAQRENRQEFAFD